MSRVVSSKLVHTWQHLTRLRAVTKLHHGLKITQSLTSKHKLTALKNVFYFGFLSFAHNFVVYCSDDKKEESCVSLTAQEVEGLLKISDEYFQAGKFMDSLNTLYDLRFSKNPEVLWRLARALYNLTKEKKITKSEKEKLTLEAHGYIQEALLLDNNNYAIHKWTAILMDAKAGMEGLGSRIKGLPIFKEHLMMAMRLNGKDATSIHMLGLYCYSLADGSWYLKQLATALFAKPPDATFEEALEFFLKAEEVDPNFYSVNLLMLGKTYLKLGRLEPARYWLTCARNYPAITEEDNNARDEADQLLRKNPPPKKQV